MRFAVYSRKSKFTGKGESIGNQVEMCTAYIISHFPETDSRDILVYEDEGFSAKDLNRPQFQKMMRESREGRFCFIICYRLDRISRNVSDFSSLMEELNERGISLVCIREQFDTSSPMGRAMMYIASVFAQLERETLAERVRDNMLMLARTGRWLGGTPPTGFDSEKVTELVFEGKLKTSYQLKSTCELRTVKLIFGLFLEHYSITSVRRQLASQNIKTKKGNEFSNQGIRQILTNPVYCCADGDAYRYFQQRGSDLCFEPDPRSAHCGLLAYGKRECKGGNESFADVSNWIIARGKHMGVVSGRDWVMVQQRLEDNKPVKRAVKAHNGYSLLSGMLCCAKCGSKMFAKTRSHPSSQGAFDYICSGKLKGTRATCDCKNLNGHATDSLVFDFLKRYLTEDDSLFRQLDLLRKKYQSEQSGATGDGCAKQIRQCETEMETLLSTLGNSPVSEQLVQRVDRRIVELEKQQAYWKERQRETEEKSDKTTEQIDQTARALLDVNQCLEWSTVPERRELLQSLIHRIEWDGVDLSIYPRSRL